MTSRLSVPFELDAKARSRRLALLNLTARDHELAHRLQAEVIRPNLAAIVEHFYAFLLGHHETASRLTDRQLLERLRRSQSEYLVSLGVEFDTSRYTNDRIRVGLTHARIGLPIATYLCAFQRLQEILIDFFPPAFTTDLQFTRRMISFVLKITAYDATLATEAYHSAEVGLLERSVADLREKSQDLQEQSLTDPLTGIANRRHVIDVLESSLEAAKSRPPRVTVLMVDLDDFKKVNDTYGHQAGDAVICQVAKILRSTLREADFVARYGGEEFIALLPETEMEQAIEPATKVRTLIAEQAKKVGVTIRLDRVPADSYYSDKYLKAPFASSQWSQKPLDTQILQALDSKAPYNETGWRNARFDKLTRTARRTLDSRRRRELYIEAQRMLYDEGGYIIWGFPNLIDAASKRVRGLKTSSARSLGYYDFLDVTVS